MCDQRHNIIKHSGDEDEEDLDFLRLAALKSLQNKKEPTLSLQYNNDRISNNFKTHNTSTIGQNTIYSTNRIEQQQYILTQHQISPSNYNTHNENYFAATNKQQPSYRHPIDGNKSIRLVNQNLENYGIHGVEKLNINEPYIPHCLPTGTTGHSTIHSSVNTGWLAESTVRHGYHPTISYVTPLQTKPVPTHDSISGGGLSNVQLSPRSLAFVEQNNDILARRKGGNLSPNNYDRSPRRSKSPDYRRATDSSNYKQHSPNYSVTNSPIYRPSTPIYSSDFYKSTSPRRWSVSPPHNYKKATSRSPTAQNNQISRQRSPGFIRKRTISRSPQRYSSRSPQLSGPTKQRTRSRSPSITINSNTKHRSPPIISSSVRRYSRSPPIINERHSRKTSRSPKMCNISRQCSPYTSRYPVNKNRSPTNHHNKKRSPNNGSHSGTVNDIRQNRIRSPIQSSSINSHVQHQNKNYNKRKSLSPANQQQQIQRNRSRTPPPAHSSPLRKYPRRSRDRNVGAHITEQEKNHNKRSPVNKKRRGGGVDTNGTLRNRNNIVRHNMRRSQSPSAGLSNFNNYNNRKRRSRSRNSDKPKRYGDGKDNYYDRRRIDRNVTDYKKRELNFEKYEKDIDDKLNRNINKKNYNENNDKTLKIDNKLMKNDDDDNNGNLNLEIIETNDIDCGDITSLTPPLRNNEENLNEKTNQFKNIKEKSNNDAYEISHDNNNGDNKNNASENDDDDDNNDEDGIDLFPSDDSESETEGRFKSSSNRNERKTNVPTLSFAKLNASSVPDVIKDLQDVCNSNNKNSKGGGDHRFDRRSRNDRFKKNDNSRHSRNDKRRYNNDMRNRKNSRSRSVDRKNRDEFIGKNDRRGDIDSDDKRRIEKSMFKSTFQAIDNEGNKINSKAERGSSLGKFNNNENNKKRFKDSEDSLENYNTQHQIKSHSLKRSLKTSTPPIVNFDKAADKIDSSENFNIIRSLTPTTMIINQDRNDVTTNGKKSIHSRLGAMTNTFKSTKKASWTKTASSLTPPLPSFSDKV